MGIGPGRLPKRSVPKRHHAPVAGALGPWDSCRLPPTLDPTACADRWLPRQRAPHHVSAVSPPAACALSLAAVVAAAFLYALGFHDLGLVSNEEGLVLAEAEAILAGKVMYRDIDGFVAPGVQYLTALIFLVAGHSLNATRVVMAALFALTTALIWAITDRVASRRAAWLSFVAMLALKVLTFPLGNFIFYTEFAIFFALISLLGLLAFEGRGRTGGLLTAGLAVALTALFKQNIGAMLWISSLLYLLAFHRQGRVFALFLAPGIVLGASVLGYFAFTGALPALLRALVVVPFTDFYETASISYFGAFAPRALEPLETYLYWPSLFWEERFTDRGWGASWVPVARGVALLVYVAPIALVAALLLGTWRRERVEPSELLLVLTALAIYWSAFPRSDFGHVAQTLPGFLPLGARVLQQRRRRWLLAVVATPVAVVVGLFCVTLALRIPYSQRLDHPKARVRLSPPIHAAVTETLAWMDQAIPPDGRVAIIPASPIYYFLGDRPIPHRYAVLLSPNIAFDRGEKAAQLMEERGVDYVVLGRVETPGRRDGGFHRGRRRIALLGHRRELRNRGAPVLRGSARGGRAGPPIA